jgi:hypothetical protein
MTFTEIVQAVKDRLNLVSTEATTRIGVEVNDHYKRVTASLGMNTTRRAAVSAIVADLASTLTFSGLEKIINVVYRDVRPYRVLREVSIEQLRQSQPYTNSAPTAFAVLHSTATAVEVELDCIAEAPSLFTLYAEGYTTLSDLSGTDVPVIPESFHDLLVHGALADEYKKMEKRGFAKDERDEYESRLGELRFFLAKSAYQDLYAGASDFDGGSGGIGTGGTSDAVGGAASWTQTGLITFDRTANAVSSRAPFAVAAGSEIVSNLDADLLDGYHVASFLLKSGGTMVGDILFTDALYDLGKSGATRPRDGFFSRNVAVGGALSVGGAITGATWNGSAIELGTYTSGNYTATVAGTTNRISVSGAVGEGQAAVVDIAATYVGQSTITTLGTIGTGVWQGTAVGATYGGTGLNTSASSGVVSINAGTWTINNVLGTAGRVLIAGASNTVTNTGNVLINGGLHVGGDADPGDNNAIVDGTLQVAGYTLPTTDGTNGFVITTNGSGVLSWIANGAGVEAGITSLNGLSAAIQTFANDTNVTMASVTATHTITWAGTLSMARGGSAKALTASAGGIVWTDADSMEVLAGTATALQMLQSGASATPSWSTATWPVTTVANQLLYSSGTNTVAGLATQANSVLVTSAASAPSLATDIPTAVTVGGGYIYRGGGMDVSVADGGTGISTLAAGYIPFGAVTSPFASDAKLTWDNTNKRLLVDGGLHVGGTSDPGDNNILVDGGLYFDADTYISMSTADSYNFVGGGSTRMFLDASGNLRLGSLGVANNAKAPITIWSNPTAVAAGNASGLWIEIGPSPSQTATNPAQHDFCGAYIFIGSDANRSSATDDHRIWAINPIAVVNSTYDTSAYAVEGNLNNEGSEVTTPFNSHHKTIIAAVAGASTYACSAAFACTSPRAAGGYHYGYYSAGAIDAAFYVAADGALNHPTVAYNCVANAHTLLQSTGTHSSHMIEIGTGGVGTTVTFKVLGTGKTRISSSADGVVDLFFTEATPDPNTQIGFYRGTTLQGSITTTAASTAYTSVSDRRLKERIEPLDAVEALQALRKIDPVLFSFKQYPDSRHCGFMADDLAKVFPCAVFGEKNAVDSAGEILPQQVDLSKIIPWIVASIQELARRPS